MSLSRSALRAAVRTAVSEAAALSDFTIVPGWGRQLSPDALPGLCVFTPREMKQRNGTHSYQRQTDLIVLVKRAGGDDLEDLLDLDAEAVEVAVLPVLLNLGSDAEAMSIDTEIPGNAEERVGTISITFRITQLS